MDTRDIVRLPDRPVRTVDPDALLTRARRPAATPGLDVEHRTLARAGRIVLGLEREAGA